MANWFSRLFSPAAPQEPAVAAPESTGSSSFSTDIWPRRNDPLKRAVALQDMLAKTFQKTVDDFDHEVFTGDDAGNSGDSIKGRFNIGFGGMSDTQATWYASQGFLGYQSCAMIAQHWLVSKACSSLPEDAVRNGYEITVNGQKDADPAIIEAMQAADKRHKISQKMIEFGSFGRIFGVRHALFLVDSADPEYYEKPFNPDAVTRGSYRGITQVDPYWITPMLDANAAGNPASPHFYEPTWWIISGKKYHRTHFVIMRRGHIPDVLKPSYYYGGMPLTQEIYERVYAAERCANESPQLLLTKRANVVHIDVEKAMMNQEKFEERMASWMYYRDNYGIKMLNKDEVMEQFDTALADLDATIMTQYQLVAAIARVPATKLLGTSPKGFNATGEYEESNYHEELESTQVNYLQPFLERHHLCVMRSEVAPKLGIEPVETAIEWRPLDAMTAKEQAEVNEIKSRTGANLVNTGAITPEFEYRRVLDDPSSGYNGIEIAYEEPREDEGGLLGDIPDDVSGIANNQEPNDATGLINA